MKLFRHILFYVLVSALAVAPGSVHHKAEATEQSLTASCQTDYSSLFTSLRKTARSSTPEQISQAFCGHFSVDLNHLTDLSNTEMLHIVPLFIQQDIKFEYVAFVSENREFPLEQKPHSLHPKVDTHPPKN